MLFYHGIAYYHAKLLWKPSYHTIQAMIGRLQEYQPINHETTRLDANYS